MKKYLVVKQGILERIKNSTLKQGDRIPACSELMKLYGISAVTVRRAVSELMRDDVLHSVQGSGTFVSEVKLPWRTTSGPFYQNINDGAIDNPLIEIKELCAVSDRSIADIFELAPDTVFTYYRRLRLSEGKPVAVSISYLPLDVLGERDYLLLRRYLSLYKTLYQKNIIPTSTKETFTVEISPNKEIYFLLGQNNNTTLLHGKRLNYDETGRLFEYTDNYLLASRYKIVCWHSAASPAENAAIKPLLDINL